MEWGFRLFVFRGAPVAYGTSPDRGQIGDVSASSWGV